MSTARQRRPLSLRQRFTLLATLLGLLLGALTSATLLAVAERYEYVLATEILRGQAEDYGLRLANHMPAQLPRTQRLRGYRLDDPTLPRDYARFPPGVREVPGSEAVHVGVFDTAAGRLVFVIDLGDIEATERLLHLLVAAMLLSATVLAGWLGWWLSGVALKPVHALAEGVDALPVQPRPTRLADAASDDDLGRLAHAIDRYQARLVDADAHEQAFLADASHELRTPLAVIQGVAEVLLDDDGASPAQRARHARLARGVGEMHRLLEAMLAAARRRPLQLETIAAAQLLREAAAIALAGKPGITASIDADGDLHTAPREAVLLVAGLARKLAQPRTEASLQLVLESGQIVLRMTPEDADANAATALRADTGTGSALLDRLAQRLGWQVAFDGSARVCVELNSDPAVKA